MGRYRVEGDAVHVDVRLFLDGTPSGSFEVTGSARDPDALAGALVARLQEAVR